MNNVRIDILFHLIIIMIWLCHYLFILYCTLTIITNVYNKFVNFYYYNILLRLIILINKIINILSYNQLNLIYIIINN